MKILIVGGGGREHALAWAVAQSERRPEVLVAPGNPGTATLARNIPVAPNNIDGLVRFAVEETIDLTIVGPEQPLVAGIVDQFQARGLAIVGPTSEAARLEGSKAFAKAFMDRYGIPTARHETFATGQFDEALAHVQSQGAPIVVKADGLAAGKGAIVCMTIAEAEGALRSVMINAEFGSAGRQVVVEEFMHGEEASVFAVSDGTNYVLLAPAQDHKRIGDGDTGPNTGGMGAYAPAPIATAGIMGEVRQRIIEPTLSGMATEGNPYKGILYCGLMMTAEGPKVVEFNCRLGDPEAQVVLPLLDADAVELFSAVAEERISQVEVRQKEGAAACVVLASAGYPGAYEKGKIITGLDADSGDSCFVFHSGTSAAAGELVTAGGRVLGVTGRGSTLQKALERAYERVDQIHFDGIQFRRDIGRKGLMRLSV